MTPVYGSLKKSAHCLSGNSMYQSAGTEESHRYFGSKTDGMRKLPSARNPSLMPQRLVPVKVNFSITREKRRSSVAFSVDSALLAN